MFKVRLPNTPYCRPLLTLPYAMRISSFCSSVRARGFSRFNAAMIVFEELSCKELGLSLELETHVAIFHSYCRKTCGVFNIPSCISNRVLIRSTQKMGENYRKV